MTLFGVADAIAYGIAAAAYLLLLTLLLLSRPGGPARALLAAGCAVSAIWAGAAAVGVMVGQNLAGDLLDVARSAILCVLVIDLLGHLSAGVRVQFALSAGLAAICVTVMTLAVSGGSRMLAMSLLALAIYGTLLVENLYRNTEPERRWHINLLLVGLGGVFVYDLLFYADAALFDRLTPLLSLGRTIPAAILVPLLAVTAARNRDWVIDIHVSRDAVFHTGTLIASGLFLLGLAVVGEAFRVVGPVWAGLAEIALVTSGMAAIGVMLTSGSLRSRWRRLLVEHFFSYRYDYRKEWLRCTERLSGEVGKGGPWPGIIKALAAVTDSPGGQLWMRDPEGASFHWSGSWNLPASGGGETAAGALVTALDAGEQVVDLEHHSPRPDWLKEVTGARWAVPLNHLGKLVGFVVLAAPRAPWALDDEATDLLRVIGRQAASYAAEWQNAKAVLETRELRDFSNRFAFAVHDIKNVAGQLSMIVQNAARFRGDPDFHEDVLATVEAALGRVNRLLARLRAEHPNAGLSIPVDIVAAEVAAIRRARGVPIDLRHDDCRAPVAINGDDLRQAISHLCDNAVEAATERVSVEVSRSGPQLLIDIIDDGGGMSAEFIRDELFAPFGSTKRGGLGIGAYQARELVRRAGGDVIAQSRPGVGTLMRIVLPCADEQARASLLSTV